MIKLFTITLTLLLGIATNALAGETLVLNSKRTIDIIGVVNGEILNAARQIDRLSRESKEPIYLVINSPGGSVVAGTAFLSAMEMAQKRGATFHCVSGVLAASMAFQILASCDKRYALEGTALLFHGVRMFFIGSITTEIAKEIHRDLAEIDARLGPFLRESMGMSEEAFKYHNDRETLWTTSSLLENINKDWITIVKDVEGTGNLFVIDRKERVDINGIKIDSTSNFLKKYISPLYIFLGLE